MKKDDGEDVSTIEIKKYLKDLIKYENKKKPVTDQVIVKLLKEKGYNVARRTVAKYREQMDIPVARLRKSI
jgi:RNA polymerase sigma-54 factor